MEDTEDKREDSIANKFSPHGLVISKHIDVLLNDINLSELLPYLYAKKLVSEEEWLSAPVTVLDARSVTKRVLGRLMKKESTEEEFLAFMQCLKDCSGHLPHKDLADTLEKPFLEVIFGENITFVPARNVVYVKLICNIRYEICMLYKLILLVDRKP